MNEDENILKEIIEMLEGNGNISRDLRDRLVLKALGAILLKIKRVEETTLATYIREKPLRTIGLITLSFVLLHEFATYINIGILLRFAARALGIPID